MANEPYPPVDDYALLSDYHSSGLVSRRGSIDWACFRRFDALSTFARILDWERGGFCCLAPLGSEHAGRAYLDGTMILLSDHRAGQLAPVAGATRDGLAPLGPVGLMGELGHRLRGQLGRRALHGGDGLPRARWTQGDDQVGATAVSIAAGKANLPFGVVFVRGILANALVCLAV
ncbi:MAG: trehalase-like domain-containing protein [Actinomycetota bacterium]